VDDDDVSFQNVEEAEAPLREEYDVSSEQYWDLFYRRLRNLIMWWLRRFPYAIKAILLFFLNHNASRAEETIDSTLANCIVERVKSRVGRFYLGANEGLIVCIFSFILVMVSVLNLGVRDEIQSRINVNYQRFPNSRRYYNGYAHAHRVRDFILSRNLGYFYLTPNFRPGFALEAVRSIHRRRMIFMRARTPILINARISSTMMRFWRLW
jgi:hypothetical protein